MTIPKEVKSVVADLKKKGYNAHVIGGCVRDFLRGSNPEDWDIATNAKPEEIRKVFPRSFYENRFFTVTVQTDSKNSKLREIEITTYRSEAKYTDKRHPDEVKFAKTIKEDLARRDLTINAMAFEIKPQGYEIIDPFEGQDDLKNKIIRTVGDPLERFSEDALRMMRAVRFTVTLGKDWQIEAKTSQAIKKNAAQLQAISKERVREELMKIIMSERASEGIDLLRELGLLKYIIPEIIEGYGVSQNKHHIYDCYEHSLRSLGYGTKCNFNKHVRLSALLHDIGKPQAKRGKGQNATFYGHEVIGAKITDKILNNLKFPKKDIEKIVRLVRYHLFYYNVGEVTESSVRRLVRQVGLENMEELLQLRMCDRIGSGVPKAEPYKLRHLKYLIEKVSKDPLSVKMLKITGNDVMSQLNIQPGPKIGHILDILLGEVLEDPKKNTKKYLSQKTSQLGGYDIKNLREMSQSAREKRNCFEVKEDQMTKKKYWVT